MTLLQAMDWKYPSLGLATLNGEIYVRHENKSNTEIAVYDTEAYRLQRTFLVPSLGGVTSMASCQINQCTYIADFSNNVVHRVDNKHQVKQWNVDDKPWSLSVNSLHNVLVTCREARIVKEFTTNGDPRREVSLEEPIVNPHHAVELTPDQLVVCHGGADDDQHRVCLVDMFGTVQKFYGGSKGSGCEQLNVPFRLAVKGVIFVEDLNNDRVLMLSPTLSLLREVVSGLNRPCRFWLDDDNDRLYIGVCEMKDRNCAGQVNVYGVESCNGTS